MCREECYKDHYIFCNQILATKKNQQKSIVSSKKPLNAKACNVDPFITVSETWITSLSDLWSLGATCKLFQVSIHDHRHAKRIIDTNLQRLVKPFGFNSLYDFNNLLTKSDAILAGSMPLQAIIGENFSLNSDMDLYVRSTSNERDDDAYYQTTMHTMLKRLGWRLCDSDAEYDNDYMDFPNTIAGTDLVLGTTKVNLKTIPGDELSVFSKAVCLAVYTYEHNNDKKIQVIVVNKDSLGKTCDLGSIVYHYDFSFLYNYYNGINFRMIYPHDAITKVGHFHKGIVKSLKGTLMKIKLKLAILAELDELDSRDYLYYKLDKYHEKVLSRMDKYNSRGFIIVGKQPPRDIRQTTYELW